MGLYASQPVNQRTSEEVNQSTTSGPKPYQKPPKCAQNKPKIGSKSVLEGVLGRLGGSWGGSWALLGSILAPRGPKSPKKVQQGTVLIAKHSSFGGPKRSQNRSEVDPKRDHFVLWFVGSLLRAFWCQFGSNLGTKNLPKWSPVGFKIDLIWSIVLEASFGRMLGTFFMVLRPKFK